MISSIATLIFYFKWYMTRLVAKNRYKKVRVTMRLDHVLKVELTVLSLIIDISGRTYVITSRERKTVHLTYYNFLQISTLISKK